MAPDRTGRGFSSGALPSSVRWMGALSRFLLMTLIAAILAGCGGSGESTSRVEVRSGTLRSISVGFIARGVSGNWAVETVGPDDLVSPAITDDLIVAEAEQPLALFNPLFNDTGGTNGFDVSAVRIEPIDGLTVGEGGSSGWIPSDEEQMTTYELCDSEGVCRAGQIRFIQL